MGFHSYVYDKFYFTSIPYLFENKIFATNMVVGNFKNSLGQFVNNIIFNVNMAIIIVVGNKIIRLFLEYLHFGTDSIFLELMIEQIPSSYYQISPSLLQYVSIIIYCTFVSYILYLIHTETSCYNIN